MHGKWKIYVVVAFTAIGAAVAVGLLAFDQRSATAAPDVFVSGGRARIPGVCR